MSSTTDKIKGVTNELVGKTKQAAGSVLENDKLRRDGVVQEVKGNLQQARGDAKDAIKKAVDRA